MAFFGKVEGVPLAKGKLLGVEKKVVREATRGLDLVAADLLNRAIGLAPIFEGDLILSARVIKHRRQAGTLRRTVGFGTDHAVFAHDVVSPTGALGLTAGGTTLFGIGVFTALKPSTADGPPGGKFLLRPYNGNVARYKQILENSIERGTRAAGR